MYQVKKEVAKEIRQKYKMQYICEKANISQAYLSNIFNGKNNCSIKIAKPVADVIGCKVEDLFIKN